MYGECGETSCAQTVEMIDQKRPLRQKGCGDHQVVKGGARRRIPKFHILPYAKVAAKPMHEVVPAVSSTTRKQSNLTQRYYVKPKSIGMIGFLTIYQASKHWSPVHTS